jgi:predicted enzyme related to lactoylglutathione lyase
MELQQCRIVGDDVAGLAGFYARLLGVPTALNEYYVEIQAGPASVGFSRRRFTEYGEADTQPSGARGPGGQGAGSQGASSQGASSQGASSQGASSQGAGTRGPGRRDEIILDFRVDDVDAEYPRIAALGVEWVMPPTTQPWGNRSMIFRDPAGNLVNVFSRPSET